MDAERTKRDQAPLSRDRVMLAAIELADSSGLEALTMRRLGRALGVEAMSLYNHVANKDDLLDGIVDIVLGEVDLQGSDGEWRTTLRTIGMSTHEVLRRHPWAAERMLSRTIPARFRYMEAVLGSLRRGGLTPAQTDHAYHALDSYIAGFTLWQSGLRIDDDTLPALGTALLERFADAGMPYMVEHIHEHLREPDPDDEGSFAFGLDLILGGLDRLIRGMP